MRQSRIHASEEYASEFSNFWTIETNLVFVFVRVGCDIVVFLVFNEFTSCTGGGSDGHQFSGIAEGGACEGAYGSGYVIAVDQGTRVLLM